MSMVITKTGATERIVVGPIVDTAGAVLTGLTTIKLSVFRGSDLKLLDFATNGFTLTPGTLNVALSEIDSVRVPGMYQYNLDTSLFVSPTAKDKYFAYVSQIGAATAANALQAGEMRVGEIVDNVEANLATAATNFSGTATAGGASTITLTGGSATDDTYKFSDIEITSGTGRGQTRTILTYLGSTLVATVNRPWITVPDNTSVFALRSRTQPIIVDAALAQAGGASIITFSAASSSVADYYVGLTVEIAAGTGLGQARVVSSYNGTTKVATMASAWATAPDNTSVYVLLPVGRSIAVVNLDKTGYALTGGEETAIATAVLGTAVPGAFAAGTLGYMVGTNMIAPNALATGTAQAGAVSTITLASGASATDNLYRHCLIEITAGTGAGQARSIAFYVGSTKIATVTKAWNVNPDATSVYAVLPAASDLVLASGTAQAGAASTITLASTSSSTDNLYNGTTITITSGTGAGQERLITGYVGTTKVATVDEAWVTSPDSTSVYELLPLGRVRVALVETAAVTTIQAGLALTTDVTSATSTITGAITSATSPLATTAALTTAKTAIDAANATLAAIQGGSWSGTTDTLHALRTAVDAAQADLVLIKGAGFVNGTDDLHSAHTLLAATAKPGDSMALITGAIAATSFASAAITAAAFATNSVNANALAADAVAEIQAGLALDATVAKPGDLMGLANNAITSAKIATNAITANGLASDAVVEIQTGLALTSDVTASTAATGVAIAAVPAAVNAALGVAHGSGSWATATGFSTLTAAEVWATVVPGAFSAGEAGNVIATIEDDLTAIKGVGWTSGETLRHISQTGDALDGKVTSVQQAFGILNVFNVLPGSTTTTINTNCADPDNTWRDKMLVAPDPNTIPHAITTRVVSQIGGVFTVSPALPWIPSDPIIIRSDNAPATPVALATAQTTITDAVAASTVAVNGHTDTVAAALPSAVNTTLGASHGAGSWATATGFATSGALTTLQAGVTTLLAGVNVAAIAVDAITGTSIATTAVTKIQAGLATDSGLSNVVAALTSTINARTISILDGVSDVAGAVWATADGASTMGAALRKLRQWTTWSIAQPNKKTLSVDGLHITVTDDDGVTPMDVVPVASLGGTAVAPAAGESVSIG